MIMNLCQGRRSLSKGRHTILTAFILVVLTTVVAGRSTAQNREAIEGGVDGATWVTRFLR